MLIVTSVLLLYNGNSVGARVMQIKLCWIMLRSSQFKNGGIKWKKLTYIFTVLLNFFTIYQGYLTTICACEKNMGENYFSTPQQPLLYIVAVLIISVTSRLLLSGTWSLLFIMSYFLCSHKEEITRRQNKTLDIEEESLSHDQTEVCR